VLIAKPEQSQYERIKGEMSTVNLSVTEAAAARLYSQRQSGWWFVSTEVIAYLAT
jgi:hypothetical protein